MLQKQFWKHKVPYLQKGRPSYQSGLFGLNDLETKKYGEQAKAGIFNAAYGLEVVAEIFAQENKLEHFADFASNNGAKFYGYQPSEDELLLPSWH